MTKIYSIGYGRPDMKVKPEDKVDIDINAIYFTETGAAHIVLQKGPKVEMITKAIHELVVMGVFNWQKLNAILPTQLLVEDEPEEEGEKDEN